SKENAFRSVIQNWANQDPVSAAEWLKSQHAGKSREAAVNGYIDSVSYSYPEVAIQWAENMAEDQDRKRKLQSVVSRWIQNDEKAALAWLDKTQALAEDVKNQIRTRDR
ncbi:MAG: hypothetical protein JWM16_571, partial [Verrucomicrobiales bacterium]|nr:hypothetical protein [Verrucomicrobiales bacterium]